LSGLRAELLEPITVKGKAKDADLERLDQLAEEILDKHGEMGVLEEGRG